MDDIRRREAVQIERQMTDDIRTAVNRIRRRLGLPERNYDGVPCGKHVT